MSITGGEFPVHQAALAGKIDVVQALLAKGADKLTKRRETTKETLLSF